jgi:predicted nucleotidyltransferase
MAVRVRDHLVAVLEKHTTQIKACGIARLGIFGSYATGKPDNESDVDVLVEFEPGKKNFDNFIGLATFLEELFDRRVELVTRESLSPYIGPRILEEVEYVTLSN